MARLPNRYPTLPVWHIHWLFLCRSSLDWRVGHGAKTNCDAAQHFLRIYVFVLLGRLLFALRFLLVKLACTMFPLNFKLTGTQAILLANYEGNVSAHVRNSSPALDPWPSSRELHSWSSDNQTGILHAFCSHVCHLYGGWVWTPDYTSRQLNHCSVGHVPTHTWNWHRIRLAARCSSRTGSPRTTRCGKN